MKRTMKMVAGLAFLAASVGSAVAHPDPNYEPDWTLTEDGLGDIVIEGYSGNLLLYGPGQELPQAVSSSAFPDAYQKNHDSVTVTQSLGNIYKFTFVGIEARADADGVPGWYSWGGYMQTFSEQEAIDRGQSVLYCTEVGSWHFKGSVNGVSLGEIKFASAAIGYAGTVQTMTLNSPVVFQNQDITLRWDIHSNARGIDGYMGIVGTIQRNATIVTGQLLTPIGVPYQPGESHTIAFDIDRNGNGIVD